MASEEVSEYLFIVLFILSVLNDMSKGAAELLLPDLESISPASPGAFFSRVFGEELISSIESSWQHTCLKFLNIIIHCGFVFPFISSFPV